MVPPPVRSYAGGKSAAHLQCRTFFRGYHRGVRGIAFGIWPDLSGLAVFGEDGFLGIKRPPEAPSPHENLFSVFDEVPDPRTDNARHGLCELLEVAFVAVLFGATSCAEMAGFGRAKKHVFRAYLKSSMQYCRIDTCSTVFRLIDPKALDAPVTTRLTALPTSPSCAAAPRPRPMGHLQSLAFDQTEAGRLEPYISSQPTQPVSRRLGQTRLP